MRLATYAGAAFTMAVFLSIVGYILIKGVGHLSPELFSWEYNSENVSLMPALINTLLMTALSLIVAVPLGIGRAIGEAMAVMMVAGNRAVIPNSLVKGVRTLTSNIVMEMGYATDLHREALIATAVVLFVFILLINLLFSVIKRKAKL